MLSRNRIGVGLQQDCKVVILQTLPACDEPSRINAGEVARFLLHASMEARAEEGDKLERLS